MNPQEAAKIQAFLGSLLSGAAELGMEAYPLVKLYKRAKAENLDFWELFLTDEETTARLTKAMEKHVAKLPPALFSGLRVVLNARQQVDLRKKQEADNLAAAKAAARASKPSGATVGGRGVEDV